MDRKKVIIGLTGKLGSGKGTIAEILATKGFFSTSLSDRIREEIRSRNLDVTRERLLEVSDELRRKEGPTVLAKRTWEMVILSGKDRVVIDSIRGEAEVDYLKKQSGFFLVGVIADVATRFLRIKERGRESDPQTLEEFEKVEEKDVRSGKGLVGRNIQACLDKADFTIENNGTVEELKKQIDKIIKIV